MSDLLNELSRKDLWSGNKVKLKSARLDQFNQPNHNILYVTGLSGSGKSTLSRQLAKQLKAEVVELDSYYGMKPSNGKSRFHRFLKKNNVDAKHLLINNKLNYNESDKIYGLLKEYAKDRRIIAEGVQLLDNTMGEPSKIREDLLSEPVLSLQISQREAHRRAMERDKTELDEAELKRKKSEWRSQNQAKKEFDAALGLTNLRRYQKK